jgi:hypothetical protein
MNGFEHPGTILLIHDMKVRTEMERDRREHLRGEYLPRFKGDREPRLRRAISNGLFALARRIAPADAIPAGARR